MEVPPAKSNRFLFGENPSVVVVTLWTPLEVVAQKLDKRFFGIMGNLYSGERGIDPLLRTLLANPAITHLVLTGADVGHSGQVLSDFFEKGFSEGKTRDTQKPVWRVNSDFEGYLDLDLPADSLEELRQSIRLMKWDYTTPFSADLFAPVQAVREKRVFEKKTEFEKKYFGEASTYVFRSSRFVEAFLRSIGALLRFGSNDGKSRRLFNAVFVLESDPQQQPFFPDGIGFSANDAETLAEKLVPAPDGEELSRLLARAQNASIPLKGDSFETSLELELSGDNLLAFVSLREFNAMETGLLLAAFSALLPRVIAPQPRPSIRRIVLTLCVTRFFVPDAEIARAEALFKTQSKTFLMHPSLIPDARGNFVIYISQGEICVEHLSAGNELLFMYCGKTALELRDQLMAEDIVGTIPHGLYLGTELAKAEIALREGLEYVQDKPLDLSKKVKPQ